MSASVADRRREQSRPEELVNSLTHGAGVVAALVGTPILIVHAVRDGPAGSVVGASLFAAAVLILYLSSTLYHALPAGAGKRLFRVFDHASIFLLIAGTYTPFTLGVLGGALGWTLFGIVWGLALFGITLKAVGRASHPVLSTGLYLLMGWMVVVAAVPLVQRLPTAGLVWLIAGGLCYTLGVVFYSRSSKMRFGHAIWHLFVLGGTVCHYFAVLWYAA
jgi:hemolysin III